MVSPVESLTSPVQTVRVPPTFVNLVIETVLDYRDSTSCLTGHTPEVSFFRIEWKLSQPEHLKGLNGDNYEYVRAIELAKDDYSSESGRQKQSIK